MSDDENALPACTFASLGIRGARLSARATGAGSIRAAARVTNAIYRILAGRFVSKDSDQIQTAPRKFKLGPLGNLNQVTKGLAKAIRAMADGTLDSQVGARICNGLGIMRACLETQKLEQLESRMDEIADRVARHRDNRCAREDQQP